MSQHARRWCKAMASAGERKRARNARRGALTQPLRAPFERTPGYRGPRRARPAHMARLSGWRRIANAMWHSPDDPQIYGALDVDATAALAFLERCRAAGHRVTATHLVGRAVARALVEVPDLNVRIRAGHALPREAVDVFFITAVRGGHDLSGVKVVDLGARTIFELAGDLAKRANRMKRGDDRELARTKSAMDSLPAPLLRVAMRATAFLTNTLRLELPPLGLHPSPFGSAMVTSVGMFGLPQGFAPLAWMYDVPLLVLVGEITEKPVVVDHQVVVRPVLPITATIDHRYVDGWHVSKLMKAFQGYLTSPASFEPDPAGARLPEPEPAAPDASATSSKPDAAREPRPTSGNGSRSAPPGSSRSP